MGCPLTSEGRLFRDIAPIGIQFDSSGLLVLTLTKRWFNMIDAGIKREEYRALKPYWEIRLLNKDFSMVKFRNGYWWTSRWNMFKVESICVGRPKTAWFEGDLNQDVIVIKLGDFLARG